MYFLVDPIVLCLPNEEATSDKIEDFIQHLMDWNEFITTNQDDDKFCISQTCYDALYRTGRYPLRKDMHELIDSRSDLSFNAQDAFLACQQIIESACWPTFEEAVSLPLKEFDIDSKGVCLDPDLVGRIPQEIKQSFQETFGYVAYAKKILENCIASKLHLLTHPIEEKDKKAKIAIDITLLIGDDFSQVKTDLPLVESPEDLLKYKSLTDIWEDTEQAIEWAKADAKININTRDLYTIGPKFNQSLKNCQFPTHPNRLNQCFKKIAQLLTNQDMNPSPLKTGEGGNQIEQKVRNSTWKAWRLHITEGPGAVYRLHYWKNGNNYVFSNVVSKSSDNFSICGIDENIVPQN